jgi:hypothetical protein
MTVSRIQIIVIRELTSTTENVTASEMRKERKNLLFHTENFNYISSHIIVSIICCLWILTLSL